MLRNQMFSEFEHSVLGPPLFQKQIASFQDEPFEGRNPVLHLLLQRRRHPAAGGGGRTVSLSKSIKDD